MPIRPAPPPFLTLNHLGLIREKNKSSKKVCVGQFLATKLLLKKSLRSRASETKLRRVLLKKAQLRAKCLIRTSATSHK